MGVYTNSEMTQFEDLRTRSEAGDANAQSKLGEMYFTGIGVLRDSTEAVRWYRLAAVHLRREILMAGEGVKGIKDWVLDYIIGSFPLLMVFSSGVD